MSTEPEFNTDTKDVNMGDEQVSSVPDPTIEPEKGRLYDASGTEFDPAIHVAKEDGNPSFTSKGNFRRKKGMGSKQNRTSSSKSSAPDPQRLTPEQQQEAAVRMAAQTTVDSMAMLGQMLVGDEAAFIREQDETGNVVYDERMYGIDAFERYYRSKGITDVPPGVIVATWLCSYIGRRVIQGPQTRNMAQRFGDWVKASFFRRRQRQRQRKQAEETDEARDD